MKKRRWTCIDILKCLAAIAVVEIHKPLEIQGIKIDELDAYFADKFTF